MVKNSQHQGNLRSDLETYRINKLGQFLRKYFFDELPQLVNILKGDMNFIGPRPHSIYDHEVFQKKLKAYHKRHYIKPGITGLAQVNGYNGPIKNLNALFRRTSYDLLYIKKKNFILDFQIIVSTFFIPFLKRNQEEKIPDIKFYLK
jgi:putative colanic acid biosynthesis UDP-glucose lipid carrier transferase